MKLKKNSPFDREPTGTNFMFANVEGAFPAPQFSYDSFSENDLIQSILQGKKQGTEKFYFNRNKYYRFTDIWIDFERLKVFPAEAVSTKVQKNRIDFEPKKVTQQKKEIRFNSRMNSKVGYVSTKMGLGMKVDFEREGVRYYIFFLYHDSKPVTGKSVEELINYETFNLVSLRGDGLEKHTLAIELETPNLKKFTGFVHFNYDNQHTIDFLRYSIKREHKKARKSISDLQTFYAIVPSEILKLIGDAELGRDLFELLKWDQISKIYDTSDAMLNILYAIDDLEQLYQYTIKHPDKVLDVYRHITNDELRGKYCDFLTALGYIYQEVDFDNIKTVWSGKQYIINSDIIFDAKSNVRIEQLYNRKKIIKNPFQTTAEVVNRQNEYGHEYKLETWSDENFHPMKMMLLKNMDNGEVNFVPAIQVKYIADRNEWDFVAKIVFSVLNIVSIMVSFGVLIKGAVGLIRFLAVADIVISTTDQALENEDFKKSLAASGEAGKWFVENWGTISLISSLGIMSWETAYNIHKHGDKIIAFFKNSKKNPKFKDVDLEEVIAEMENLKKRADDLFEAGNQFGGGGNIYESFFKNANIDLTEEILTSKVFGQSTDYTCVATSLKMVLDDFGKILSEDYIAGLLETVTKGPSRGASILDIQKAIENAYIDFLEVITRGKNGEKASFKNLLDSLEDEKGKVIVSVKTEEFGAHALVIEKVENERVFLRDPLPLQQGSTYSISTLDFKKVFNYKFVAIKQK